MFTIPKNENYLKKQSMTKMQNRTTEGEEINAIFYF